MIKVGFYQFCPVFGDKRANLHKIVEALERANADLLVLPELCTTGYLFTSQDEVNELSEPIPGPTTRFFENLTQRKNLWLVLGMAERDEISKKCYNSAVLIGPDGYRATYRKAHLFFEEKLYFVPGDTPFRVYDLGAARMGMLVCFDHFFPEATRALALQGAQIICHPSNLVLPGKGQQITRVRAMENRIFWILANRYGVEERGGKKLSFTGASQIVAPNGELLAQAPSDSESLQIVEISPAEANDKRVTALNDLFADRRPEMYNL
ncbi:MAG: acyltransferase [Candidatus Bipolaricaulota bacterium]|nr:acyltransferase [Candidatus Bipolaricaulota bacterium]MCS7274558.1 acyltransferase [Candidatus Bipolaricaulota bacterium]MDW8111012.1 nitrilase-related carbon-nitrogen hydrolase [Candidatus Bipolaricaulota bacterium]MDW8329289.1 nitrilase-related carbon-nitrogen hydrolase [Candidatus Bipolaricaulota bacterium]